MLNYARTLMSEDPIPDSCECHGRPFMDPQIRHVVTGKLSIVENRKLRNLLAKGTGFRECYKFSKTDVLSALKEDLDSHIKKQSEKSKIPEDCFKLWKSDIIEKVQQKLDTIKLRKF